MREMTREIREAWEGREGLYDGICEVTDVVFDYVSRPLGAAVLAGVVLFVAAGFVTHHFHWLFFAGPPSDNTDPSHQSTVAVPVPAQAPDQALPSPFAGVTWLDQVSAVQLRTQSNAVNFAWLQDGSAQYASDFSMPFDIDKYGWQEALNDPNISNVSFGKTLTSISFTAGRADYTLNLYEPFAVGNDTSTIYMFALSEQGQVKLYRSGMLTKISLDQVQGRLTFQVPPNPDLTLTKGR